jgi:hypothetical protein
VSNFELHSEYQPTGDQPSAIAQLTDGLRAGVKEQTLLGVTGSGKSVIGSAKILVKFGGQTVHIPIGTLDGVFSEPLPESEDCTQVAQINGDFSTVSLDTQTGENLVAPVAEVSRHRYRGMLYEVATKCGRSNVFTDSHNVYVLRQGELALVASADVRVGDWLPVPQKLPVTGECIEYIDTREWLPEDAFYVQTPRAVELAAQISDRQKAWRVAKIGERMHLADHKLLVEPQAVGIAEMVGSNKLAAMVPVRVPATQEFWRFLGLFIAEGHATEGYIVLSTADVSIADEFQAGAACFGLRLAKRPNYDYQITGVTIATLMKQWCGERAQRKHLPMFWPQCSDEQLGALLSGIFAGDGWVEPQAVCLGSVSRELIHDVQCALLRFGIHARVRLKRVRYQGTLRNSWILSMYGQDLASFGQSIGFGLERKDALLRNVCAASKPSNTNVDLFPLPVGYIREL